MAFGGWSKVDLKARHDAFHHRLSFGIDLQRRIQRSCRNLAIAALVSASPAGLEVGVVGQNFQTGFKRFRRERKIVFLQR